MMKHTPAATDIILKNCFLFFFYYFNLSFGMYVASWISQSYLSKKGFDPIIIVKVSKSRN